MERISRRKKDRGGGALKPLIGTVGRAPFYDPYDTHIHIWVSGTIPSAQNSKNKYTMAVPKQFTGRYCKVCHEVKHPFYNSCDNSLVKGDPYYVKNLRNAMKQLNERPAMNWERLLNKLNIQQSKYVMDFNKESILDELLTLTDTNCSVYKQSGTFLIQGISPDRIVTVTNGTVILDVPETLVIPVYDIPKYAPIQVPPRIVPKGTVGKWRQLWKTYLSWKILQDELKLYLSVRFSVGIEILMERNEDMLMDMEESSCTCRIKCRNQCYSWRGTIDLSNCKFLIKAPIDKVSRNYVTIRTGNN